MSVGFLLAAGCGKSASTKAPAAASPAGPTGAAPSVPSGSGTAAPRTPAKAPGATNAVLPATYTLGPGGGLAPPTVSAPKGVPILVTIIGRDTRKHQVVVQTRPMPHTVIVSTGPARVQVGTPPPGSYAILVDGHVRGHLVVGVQPGP